MRTFGVILPKIRLRELVENSHHRKTPACGLGESELWLLTPFPGNPGNPRMNSKNVQSDGALQFSSIPGLQHWESRPDVGNLGRTFGISAGRSKSRPDVRNLGRTFEILAGPSKSLPGIRTNEDEQLPFGAQKLAS